MSSYTLYTDAGNFRAFKILIAAEYNQINIKIPDFKVGTDNTTPAFLSKSPQGKIPVLENASGNVITESNAISRYIAKLRLDSELLGATLFESAQVGKLFPSKNCKANYKIMFFSRSILG